MRWRMLLRLASTGLFGILCVGGWVANPGAQETENPFSTLLDVRMGESLYRRHCATCHGRDAQGGLVGAGPDLTTVSSSTPPATLGSSE